MSKPTMSVEIQDENADEAAVLHLAYTDEKTIPIKIVHQEASVSIAGKWSFKQFLSNFKNLGNTGSTVIEPGKICSEWSFKNGKFVKTK